MNEVHLFLVFLFCLLDGKIERFFYPSNEEAMPMPDIRSTQFGQYYIGQNDFQPIRTRVNQSMIEAIRVIMKDAIGDNYKVKYDPQLFPELTTPDEMNITEEVMRKVIDSHRANTTGDFTQEIQKAIFMKSMQNAQVWIQVKRFLPLLFVMRLPESELRRFIQTDDCPIMETTPIDNETEQKIKESIESRLARSMKCYENEEFSDDRTPSVVYSDCLIDRAIGHVINEALSVGRKC